MNRNRLIARLAITNQKFHVIHTIAFLLTVSTVELRAEYKYPIGIPKAWVDPDVERPPRPEPWNSEIPGYYFVDNKLGSDNKRPYGSPSAPRKTIPDPLGPGSYCEVNGYYGTNVAGWTYLRGAGDEGPWVANKSGPAWLVGKDSEKRASFSQNVLLHGSYLYLDQVDNLAGHQKFQINTSNASKKISADHILVRNCEIDGNDGPPTSGFAAVSSSFSSTDHVIYCRVKVHGFGPDTPEDVDSDAHGIYVSAGGRNVWILDNEVYDMSGTGIVVGSSPKGPSNTSNIYVGRNNTHDTWAAGIGVKTSDHVVISQNTCHDIKWTSWSEAKCIGFQYAVESLWILYNHCYNGNLGIKGGSVAGPNPTEINIIGNLVHDIGPIGKGSGQYGITVWAGTKRRIIGNTIYGCTYGVGIPTAGDTGLVIANNIIDTCDINYINISSGSSLAQIDCNLFHHAAGKATLRLNNINYTVSEANALPNVNRSIEQPPQFSNATKLDFSVPGSSPAAVGGLKPSDLPINVYAEFEDQYQLDIKMPENPPKWNIGAPMRAVFSSAPKPTRPSAPQGVSTPDPRGGAPASN